MPTRIRSTSSSPLVTLSAAIYIVAATPAHAQCDSLWRAQTGANGLDGNIQVLATRDLDGLGPAPGRLYAGGQLGALGFVAWWSAYEPVWHSLGPGTNGPVFALLADPPYFPGVLDPVIVGGSFTTAGGVAAANIAVWSQDHWLTLGEGLPGSVLAITTLNGQIIAAGSFDLGVGTHVARWNGTVWQPLGDGFDAPVRALTVFKGELIAAGDFTMADGRHATHITRWDGAAWQPLAEGVGGNPTALETFRDELFVGTSGGTFPALTAWNGQTWRSFPDGPAGSVTAIKVFNNVFNNELNIAGDLSLPSNPEPGHMVRWTGNDSEAWRPLRAGVTGVVHALSTIDSDLAVAGQLTAADGQPTLNWARWHAELPPGSVGTPSLQTRCGRPPCFATFTIAATGVPPFTYQWRRSGVPMVDDPRRIRGATTSRLSIEPAAYPDTGLYDCVVTFLCGPLTSASVPFTVCLADFNSSGAITIDDVYIYLMYYFTNHFYADVNGSGTVTVQNLFDFIDGYLRGC